jgi:DNA invertase Pin-like site-specific DNA recombinase
MKKACLYTRISSQKQSQSNLGKEAQEAYLKQFVEREGYTIVGWFHDDAISGSIHPENRPAMSSALEKARREGAVIITAKLDRISRSVEHIAQMINKGTPFIVAEHPEADAFTLQLLACFAERERKLIGERTRKALEAKKARGETLGHLPTLNLHRHRGVETNVERGRRVAAIYGEMILEAREFLVWKNQGKNVSLQKVAEFLNEQGKTTPRGKQWNQPQLSMMLRRHRELA